MVEEELRKESHYLFQLLTIYSKTQTDERTLIDLLITEIEEIRKRNLSKATQGLFLQFNYPKQIKKHGNDEVYEVEPFILAESWLHYSNS